MSQQNFLDALKDMMEMDKDGTYSSFKPIENVEQAARREQIEGFINAMPGMDFRPQGISAPAIGGMQRGGGMIPIQQVQMSDPGAQFGGAMQGLIGALNQNAQNGLPSNSGMDSEGPMLGGLLDMLKQIGQVKQYF